MAFSSGVMRYFYPRPPRGRRRENIQCEAKLLAISIHALREEGDFHFAPDARPPKNFYPRPPRGGRPAAESLAALTDVFLSTPSARRATIPRPHLLCWHHDFYPRPPRGGRLTVRSIAPGRSQFLSTPSARRATGCAGAFPGGGQNFYPRPPRGGRPFLVLNTGRTEQISIHALREEGDPIPTPRRGESNQFLSTPSARRATPKAVKASVTMSISIHALREEGDVWMPL